MTPLISVSRLSSRIRSADVVVLDATLPPVGVTPKIDTYGRYLDGHLPGAIFFDIEELSDHSTSLPHMLPTAEEFSRNMSKLGVGDGMTIVVYEQVGVFSAPRAWWMLRTFGARQVYVLDGGLEAWLKEGLATEVGRVSRAPASFHAVLSDRAVETFAGVQATISRSHQIVDARSAARFVGSAAEPRPGISSGHMPGSISIPFTELTEDGRLKSYDLLRALFAARNVDLQQPITTTCGSGVTAAVIALGLEVAGATDVRLYDGSWAEYAQQPGAVIEKS